LPKLYAHESPNGTLILFMDSNDSIEVLSEKKMRESGWVRKI
jgi:hypothetical protein